jgi:hypothetical protein
MQSGELTPEEHINPALLGCRIIRTKEFFSKQTTSTRKLSHLKTFFPTIKVKN